jgi:hypothetical protein
MDITQKNFFSVFGKQHKPAKMQYSEMLQALNIKVV